MQNPASPQPSPVSRTILVVEDEPDTRAALKIYLEATLPGAHVVSVSNAEEAMRILDHEHIDLVLSDLRLPSMDGIQLLAGVRARHEDVHRILITGSPSMGLARLAFETAGVEGLLLKPLNERDLAITVEQVLLGLGSVGFAYRPPG